MSEIPSCGFLTLLASLVEGGSYSATWRFWHLPFCQAHGCPLLASCFFRHFLNPLSAQANLIPFEPLALEFMLSVRVFALFIWVSGVHYAYNRSSMFITSLLRKFPFSPLQFVCSISLKEVVRCLRKETGLPLSLYYPRSLHIHSAKNADSFKYNRRCVIHVYWINQPFKGGGYNCSFIGDEIFMTKSFEYLHLVFHLKHSEGGKKNNPILALEVKYLTTQHSLFCIKKCLTRIPRVPVRWPNF